SILRIVSSTASANQMTVGIGNDVALAPVDLLARVIPPRTAAFRGLDRLTVDHPSRRAGVATITLPSLLDQQEIDLFPQPFGLPRVKVTLHRRPLRKIARQQTPRTRRPQNVEQGGDNTPKPNDSRPSQGFLPRHMGLDQRPFSICRVTCIAQIFPPILLPSGFSPHLVSPMLSDTAWVSQTVEIAQFISGQALRGTSSSNWCSVPSTRFLSSGGLTIASAAVLGFRRLRRGDRPCAEPSRSPRAARAYKATDRSASYLPPRPRRECSR